MGSAVWFDGGPCAVGVVRAEDVDIDEACEGIFWGFVSLIWTEIVFDTAWSGWRRAHAASEDNCVNEIKLYPASRRSRVNVGRMDRVFIQYQTVRLSCCGPT